MKNFTLPTATALQKYLVLFVLLLSVNVGWGQTTVTSRTTSGNATILIPSGVASILVEATGAGGSGGSTNTRTYANAGGGAGGSYIKHLLSLSPGTFNYTVGAGTSGSAGGNTYFGNSTAGASAGSTVLATGGAAGINNTANGTSNTVWNFSSGGTASTSGNVPSSGYVTQYVGTSGAQGTSTGSGSATQSGAGGAGAGSAGVAGGGAGGSTVTYSSVGNPGTAPGGGGSGGCQGSSATTPKTGGAGGTGKIVITYCLVPTITSLSSSSGVSGTVVTEAAPAPANEIKK